MVCCPFKFWFGLDFLVEILCLAVGGNFGTGYVFSFLVLLWESRATLMSFESNKTFWSSDGEELASPALQDPVESKSSSTFLLFVDLLVSLSHNLLFSFNYSTFFSNLSYFWLSPTITESLGTWHLENSDFELKIFWPPLYMSTDSKTIRENENIKYHLSNTFNQLSFIKYHL